MTRAMTIHEPDERFVLRPSTIPGAGLGVFARVDLAAGDELEIVGVIVPRDSIADRCTHFADGHKFNLGDDRLLIPCGFGGMVNHADEPNLERVLNGDRIVLRALRPIRAGEELVHRYHAPALERFGLK